MPSLDARHAAKLPPSGPSPRLRRLGEDCFFGENRSFVNAPIPIALTSAWDGAFDETAFLDSPDAFTALPDLRSAMDKAGRRLPVPKEFYRLSLAERRVWLLKEALLSHTPLEILPGDLLAGARCSLLLSRCLSKAEAKSRSKLLYGGGGLLDALSAFQEDGRGCAGLTGGGFAPDYPHLLSVGLIGIQAEIRVQYDLLPKKDREGDRGVLLHSLMDACKIPVLLAERYAALIAALAEEETDEGRKGELRRMEQNLSAVPAGPAEDFYQAIQSLWLVHMTLCAESNGAGASIPLGRIDQYLLPYWQKSISRGMDPAFGKELIGCLLLHVASVRDGMTGQGNASQPLLLLGADPSKAEDNPLTNLLLETLAELPELALSGCCLLLNRRPVDTTINRLYRLLSSRPGMPIRVRFAETGSDSDASGEPAPTGERTAARCYVQLSKAVELALFSGRGSGAKKDARRRRKRPGELPDGPDTGDAAGLPSFEALYEAFHTQLAFLIRQAADLSVRAAALRRSFAPVPLADALTPGCCEVLGDITGGAAQQSELSVAGTGFATAVDSLLAIRYLVFEESVCGMDALCAALDADWYGYELLQAAARYRAPQYGRDDPAADALAARVAADFAELVESLPQALPTIRFRPSLPVEGTPLPPPFATPDGRAKGDPGSRGLSPAPQREPAAATAILHSAGAALSGLKMRPAATDGCVELSLPAFGPPEQEAAGRLKAFLRGAVDSGKTELLLSIGPDGGLSPEGEPDYTCDPAEGNVRL